MDETSDKKKKGSVKGTAAPSREELVLSHKKDTLISAGVYFAVTVASFFFNELASDPMLNIAMLYTLGVF